MFKKLFGFLIKKNVTNNFDQITVIDKKYSIISVTMNINSEFRFSPEYTPYFSTRSWKIKKLYHLGVKKVKISYSMIFSFYLDSFWPRNRISNFDEIY